MDFIHQVSMVSNTVAAWKQHFYKFHKRLISALDSKIQICGLLIDCSWAFSYPNHKILHYELNERSTRGLVQNLVQSFSTNRDYAFKIREIRSLLPTWAAKYTFNYSIFSDLCFKFDKIFANFVSIRSDILCRWNIYSN